MGGSIIPVSDNQQQYSLPEGEGKCNRLFFQGEYALSYKSKEVK